MSIQAWIILVIYSITAIMSIWMMISSKIGAIFIVPFLFIWLITIPLLTYDTHCLTDGPCGVWSWIRTVLYCITPLIVILTTLFGGGSSDVQVTTTTNTEEPPVKITFA